MKKILALLIAAVLALSLAACGNSAKGDTASADAQATQAIEETAAETEEVTEENPKMAVIGKDQLIGSWTYPGMDGYEDLTFNDDGTGSYVGLDGTDLTFTYAINPVTETYGNTEEYVDNHMIVDYSNGETEDIIIFFSEENHLCFHNSENGGYNGILNYPEWTRT